MEYGRLTFVALLARKIFRRQFLSSNHVQDDSVVQKRQINPLLGGLKGAEQIKGEFVFRGILEKYCIAMGLSHGVDYYFCPHTEVLFHDTYISNEQYRLLYERIQRSDEVGYDSNKVPRSHLRQKKRDAESKLHLMRLLCVDRMMPGRKILEVGPGEGTLLKQLRGFGYAVRGIEPLQLYASYARNVFGLDVETGFFSEETVKPNTADLILFDNVLEHLLNPMDALKLARQSLSENGVLYVAVPSAEFPNVSAAHLPHVTLWTRRALAFALECAGFSVLCAVRGRKREWVCIGQATHSPKDIIAQKPSLFQKVDSRELAAVWDAAIKRYAENGKRAARRQRIFGPTYPVVKKLSKALRRIGQAPTFDT
jgi:SAM-dependent methyltransferase